MAPRRFTLEAHGHLFDFQQLKSGDLRCARVDGRGNSRENSARRLCSDRAWSAAWDAARSRLYDESHPHGPPPPLFPRLPRKVIARRVDQLSLGGVL
jgi:hypothetical protein